MRAEELRELNDTELAEQLDEHRDELFRLRFQVVTGQLDDVTRLRRVRRDIARVLTVQRERELAGAGEQQGATG
ncbi:MAG: 50S ribosomal protein L29 [Actinobacteria bacterium]|nr:50S ribosomal protein L29 [Actinomycetota bacterium]